MQAYLFFFIFLSYVITVSLYNFKKWSKLARKYSNSQKPYGTKWIWRAGRIGFLTRWEHLRIYTNDEGIFIRPLLPLLKSFKQLFIPWDEITNARRVNTFFVKYIACDVGMPKIASIELKEKVLRNTPLIKDLNKP